MNYIRAKKFIKDRLKTHNNFISHISLYSKDLNNLINKLKNNDKIKDKICSKDNYIYEQIIIDIKNPKIDVKVKRKELTLQIKQCKLRYKIIYVIIIYKNFRHLNILLIDNKNKIVEKFDTNDSLMSIQNYKKIYEMTLNWIGLSHYKFIDQTKFIFSSSERADCNLCVPLSLLFVFISILFEVKLDEYIDLMSEFNNKDLFRISNWFINYLK